MFCLFDLICILRDTMTHRGTKMSSWWSPTPRSPELHRRCFAWALSMQVCKMQMDLFRNPFLNLLTIRHRQLAAMSWPGYYTFFISFHIVSISVDVACSRCLGCWLTRLREHQASACQMSFSIFEWFLFVKPSHAHANEHMHFTEKNLNLNNDYM